MSLKLVWMKNAYFWLGQLSKKANDMLLFALKPLAVAFSWTLLKQMHIYLWAACLSFSESQSPCPTVCPSVVVCKSCPFMCLWLSFHPKWPSVNLFVSVTVIPSKITMSICVWLWLIVNLFVCLPLTVLLTICIVCNHLFFCTSVIVIVSTGLLVCLWLSTCLLISRSISLYFCLSAHQPVLLSTHLSVNVRPHVHPSVWLSISLFICLPTCLSDCS